MAKTSVSSNGTGQLIEVRFLLHYECWFQSSHTLFINSDMKYINANLLRKELQKLKTELKVENYHLDNSEQAVGYENALNDFESLIDSLQQEPLIHTELCTLIACDIIQSTAKRAIEKPQDKDKEEDLMIKKMDYLNMLENGFSTQKLPDVNLEKEVEKYLLDNADFVTKSTSNEMVNTLARHFYELGRNQVLQELYKGKIKPFDKITAAWLDDESKTKED